MLERIWPQRKLPRALSFHELQCLQLIAEQVVLSIEQTLATNGERKKQMARQVLQELLLENRIYASAMMCDTAIEAAVRVMRFLRPLNS